MTKKQTRAAIIAVILGITACLAVEAYRHGLVVVEWLLFTRLDGHLVPIAESLPLWTRLVSPILGGLAAGLLLWLYDRESGLFTHAASSGDYLDAIRSENGQFDSPACFSKMAASLCIVASGSAIGREGAMILLAALVCSLLARRFTPPEEWKLWTACGVAAGMSTAYHAPLAGSFFIAEVFWGQFAPRSVWPVLVSAIAALGVSGLIRGRYDPLYASAITAGHGAEQYAAMLLTALAAGFFGLFYLRSISAGKKFFQAFCLSLPLRLALGGAATGFLSLLYPQVWGNGYSAIESLLTHEPGKLFIAGLFLCKFIAVLGCNGSGAPGGIFTPTMFMGAAMGASLSMAISPLVNFVGQSTLMAAAGMASTLAAVSHAPMMSAFMICELTGQYTLLPAMLACAFVANAISRRMTSESIYGTF